MPTNQTNIICKHFLEALEKQQYGWFWSCPNGGDTCKYRHALPPGYVLKRDKKAMDEQAETVRACFVLCCFGLFCFALLCLIILRHVSLL